MFLYIYVGTDSPQCIPFLLPTCGTPPFPLNAHSMGQQVALGFSHFGF